MQWTIEYFYCEVCEKGLLSHDVDEERDNQTGVSVFRCQMCGEETELVNEIYTDKRVRELSAVWDW